MVFLSKKAMNKIFSLIFIIYLTGCSNSTKFESCADSMFVLTNTLMQKRMPTEARTSDEIAQFNANSYEDKKKYHFYVALIEICKLEYSRDIAKFDAKYE